jgi:hypothetical protein
MVLGRPGKGNIIINIMALQFDSQSPPQQSCGSQTAFDPKTLENPEKVAKLG